MYKLVSRRRSKYFSRFITIIFLLIIQIIVVTLISTYLIHHQYVHPTHEYQINQPNIKRSNIRLDYQSGVRQNDIYIYHRDLEHSNIYIDQSEIKQRNVHIKEYTYDVSSNVRIVNLTGTSKLKFECMKTKPLLDNLRTVICLHDKETDMFVSGTFHSSQVIWEEDKVTRILQLLIRHRNLHFIDIGANIGTYTMFAAALGRFVLSIECLARNVIRIRRAIQLTDTYNQVVIVQNALYSRSGEYLQLMEEAGNVGGTEILSENLKPDVLFEEDSKFKQSSYKVKTITFDEILPILVARGIHRAIIKMDIEGSEHFVVSKGSRVFRTIDIPFIQMEWLKIRRYTDRATIILNFFIQHNYEPMSELCESLDINMLSWWPSEIYWVKKNVPGFC